MGDESRPVSSIQWAPVSSPQPLKRKTPAKLARSAQSLLGRIVVTPGVDLAVAAGLHRLRVRQHARHVGDGVERPRSIVSQRQPGQHLANAAASRLLHGRARHLDRGGGGGGGGSLEGAGKRPPPSRRRIQGTRGKGCATTMPHTCMYSMQMYRRVAHAHMPTCYLHGIMSRGSASGIVTGRGPGGYDWRSLTGGSNGSKARSPGYETIPGRASLLL